MFTKVLNRSLLCMLLVVLVLLAAGCQTANTAAPGEGKEPVKSSETASASVPAKESLTPELQKVSAAVLQLADEKFIPQGMTKDQLIKQMTEAKQVKEFADKGATGVHVYIKFNGADFSELDAYLLEPADVDKDSAMIAAWVDIAKLKEIAALKTVKSISEVVPPEHG